MLGQSNKIFKFSCICLNRYNRAEIIQSLRWKIGPILPQEIQEKLSYSEEEYFKNHSAAIDSYMSELDLDLTVVCFMLLVLTNLMWVCIQSILSHTEERK